MSEFIELVTCPYFVHEVLPFWVAAIVAIPIAAPIIARYF